MHAGQSCAERKCPCQMMVDMHANCPNWGIIYGTGKERNQGSGNITLFFSFPLSHTSSVCFACRLPRVASAAAAIARHWQQLGGLGGLPFAIPAMHPSSRPLKGSMPPPAHLMAPMGKFSAGTHPGAQRASIPGSREGQDLQLQQGQDQRLLHPGASQGVTHSHGLLAASHSSGSHAATDRYSTKNDKLETRFNPCWVRVGRLMCLAFGCLAPSTACESEMLTVLQNIQ